jgi:hypothetical protein
MVWVRSEYAGELAVLSAWLSALIPWNVTYSPNLGAVSALFVRFPLFQVRYVWGIQVDQNVALSAPVPGWLLPGGLERYSALATQEGLSILRAYQVWALGAAVFAIALALSIAYYTREQQVEELSVDPVRLMGGLLGLSGAVFAVATYLLYTRGLPGIPIPVGVFFLFAFAGLLLTAERVEDEPEAQTSDS